MASCKSDEPEVRNVTEVDKEQVDDQRIHSSSRGQTQTIPSDTDNDLLNSFTASIKTERERFLQAEAESDDTSSNGKSGMPIVRLSRKNYPRVLTETNLFPKGEVSTFNAWTSVDSGAKTYNQLKQDGLTPRERLRHFKDFLCVRAIAMTPGAVVPLHNIDGVDDYFFQDDCEPLNHEVLWRMNKANYRLALAYNEFNLEWKQSFKVSVETRSTVLKKDTFLEFFYKTQERVRFRVNSLDHCNGVSIIECNEVSLEKFGKFDEISYKYSDLKKKV